MVKQLSKGPISTWHVYRISLNSSRISVEMDGSEDSLLHCIKPGNMVADATAKILVKEFTLLCDVNKNDVDTDPFASEEEFEDDETIVNDE